MRALLLATAFLAAVAAVPARAERLVVPSSPADSLEILDDLRARIRADRMDVESRRRLADLLADGPSIEGRREAAEALNEALLVDESDADLWIRLARLRKRQNFRAESRRAFQRALELAPERPDVWDELARDELLRFQRFDTWGYLEDADRANRAALALDPGNPRAVRRQIRIAAYAGRGAEMDSLARHLRRLNPRDPLPHLLEGVRHVEEQDWARAERAFATAFTRMDSSTVVRFNGLGLVDPEADRVSSEEAPDSVRFVEDYWRLRDPTPADLLNPRRLDHYRRVVLADLYFALEDRRLPGWRHTPGELLVRYGIPEGWTYRSGVQRGEPFRIGSRAPYAASTMVVDYGGRDVPLSFTLIDFAMNGVYVRPPSMASSTDFFMVATPSYYESPYRDPPRGQEVEVWRFLDRRGRGRIEVAVALPDDEWGAAVLDEPERLLSRVAIYDDSWDVRDQGMRDWAFCRRDAEGRLVTVWRFDGIQDSLVVGLETLDLDGAGRSARFAPVAGRVLAGEGPLLSDLAFLRDVRFGGGGAPDTPYRRLDGEALPNPGHRFFPGEPVGIAFETYHLGQGEEGEHRAGIRITVRRATSRGWLSVLLGRDENALQNEIVFTSTAPGDRMEQLLSLAVPVLPEGDYRIRLEVEDLIDGGRAVLEAPFSILNRDRRAD